MVTIVTYIKSFNVSCYVCASNMTQLTTSTLFQTEYINVYIVVLKTYYLL